jgi:hypothetical protein
MAQELALGVAIALLSLPASAPVRAGTTCVHVDRNVAHYCGPATARLSIFAAARFRHGSCTRRRVGSVRLLQVRIGARSLTGSSTNAGLPYFSLGLVAARSGQKSGNVIAFFRARRWVGRVGSFKGDQNGGTFVAQGIAGSRGRTRGRFRC